MRRKQNKKRHCKWHMPPNMVPTCKLYLWRKTRTGIHNVLYAWRCLLTFCVLKLNICNTDVNILTLSLSCNLKYSTGKSMINFGNCLDPDKMERKCASHQDPNGFTLRLNFSTERKSLLLMQKGTSILTKQLDIVSVVGRIHWYNAFCNFVVN